MSQLIKNCDLFPVQPKPTVDGKQFISQPASLLFSPIIVSATIWISFSIISALWLPLNGFPVTSSIGHTTNLTYSPFLIAIEFYQEADKSQIQPFYTEDMEKLNQTNCPENLLQNIDVTLIRCFITKPIVGSENESIHIETKNLVYPWRVLVQKFSLDTSISETPPTLFQNVYAVYQRSQLELYPVKLLIFDSLISQSPSKQIVGIQEISNTLTSATNQTFITIKLQKRQTCLQYSVNRDSFLAILAGVTSWFQSIAGAAAVVIIFNTLVLKKKIGRQIYTSKKLQKRLTNFKLYLFNILNIVSLADFINDKFKCFQVQSALTDEIDKKISLENILRMIDNDEKVTSIDQQNDDGMKSLQSDEQKKESSVQSQSQGSADLKQIEGFDDDQNVQSVNNLLPEQSNGVFSGMLQKLNMNSIQVGFSLDHNNKSSVVSVLITIVGITLVGCLLWYLGAFQLRQLRDAKYIIRQNNDIIMGQSNTMIHVVLINEFKAQLFVDEFDSQIQFVKMDKNYKVVQTFKPKRNCTRTDENGAQQISNYCLDNKVNLQKNGDVGDKFTISVKKQYLFDLILIYSTVKVSYDTIKPIISNMTIPLSWPFRSQLQITRTYFQQGSSNQDIQYQIKLKLLSASPALLQHPFNLILGSSRQQYKLTMMQDSISYIFENIWSTTYLLFSFLIVFLILPYNNSISKNNLSKLFEEEAESQSKSASVSASASASSNESIGNKGQSVDQQYNIAELIMKVQSKINRNKLSYSKSFLEKL